MKTLLEGIIEGFVRESPASDQAKQMGLVSKGWGRWADPKTGKVTHKTDNDRLVPITPNEKEPKSEPAGNQPDLDQVAKDLKIDKTKTVTKKSIPQRKVSVKQTAAELERHNGTLDIWDEAQLSTKEIRQFETELGIDVARAVSDPLSYVLATGNDYSWAGDKEQQKSAIINSLKDQIYYWVREDGGGYDQRDMAYDVGKFQLAFPLDNKNLTDKEARRELQRSLDTPTTVSGELQKITRDGKKAYSKMGKVLASTNQSHSEWANGQDDSYDQEMKAWQINIDKEALQQIDQRMKDDPPPPIQTEQPVYRGMAMNGDDLKNFLSEFNNGSSVELPIGAFSFDSSVAGEFADTQVSHDYRPNAAMGDDAVHAVMMIVRGSSNSLNGLYMNGNGSREKLNWQTQEYASQEEVLLPSGQYKISNVESKDHDGRKFITINLVQEN